MSSHQTVRYSSSRELDLSAQCDEIERNSRDLQAACAKSIAAAVVPIQDLPTAIQVFDRTGRSNEVPRLGKLVQSIASDQDKFIKEKMILDEKFDDIKAKRPTKKGDLARHTNRVSFLGHEYIQLTQRIQQTMGATVEEYFDLIAPQKAEAVS